jgi:hypothetical protein
MVMMSARYAAFTIAAAGPIGDRLEYGRNLIGAGRDAGGTQIAGTMFDGPSRMVVQFAAWARLCHTGRQDVLRWLRSIESPKRRAKCDARCMLVTLGQPPCQLESIVQLVKTSAIAMIFILYRVSRAHRHPPT